MDVALPYELLTLPALITIFLLLTLLKLLTALQHKGFYACL